ncbi:MAG: ABC transporter ATP-binding protein [Rikenellaceae bacterium]
MITLSNLRFGYTPKRPIFDSLDMELSAGHIYGLLGRNGCGKSTLLKLITGMITPQQGAVTTLGVDPARRLPSLMRQIYYLPEYAQPLSTTMHSYTSMVAPLYDSFDHEALEGYMSEFELEMDKRFDRMSLGERRKANIAFALACKSRILVMDEPTNGLDIPSKSQFRKIVARETTDDRMVIISTHQVRDLDNLIDSIIILNQNHVALNATVGHIAERLTFKQLTSDESAIYDETNSMTRWGGWSRIDRARSRGSILSCYSMPLSRSLPRSQSC